MSTTAAGSPQRTSSNGSLKRRVKAAVERALGVQITRVGPQNKWSDASIRRLRTWTTDDVVFDVGANDGRTVLRLQEHLPSPRIYAFEPVSSTYRTLVEQTRHLPNIRCFQLALGAEPARQEIYLNPVSATNSFSRDWSPATGTETVDVSTVDAVMAEQGIDFVHFLKIDTEGYEMEVLRGAAGALRDARVGLVQVEVGFDQTIGRQFATLEDARVYLAPFGYRLYGIFNQCRTRGRPPEGWSERQLEGYRAEVLAYCDALFMRADLSV